MGEAIPASRGRWGLVAVVVTLVLLGSALLSALGPSSALACSPTTNPDGSKTCTGSSFSFPCPTSAGGSTTIFDIINVPVAATVTGHTLTFSPNPPCTNATAVEQSFEDNATSQNPDASFPNPGPGEKAVRVIYKITCNTTPCAGSPSATFKVDFTVPSGGGSGGSASPSAVQLPTVPPVKVDNKGNGQIKVPKSGIELYIEQARDKWIDEEIKKHNAQNTPLPTPEEEDSVLDHDWQVIAFLIGSPTKAPKSVVRSAGKGKQLAAGWSQARSTMARMRGSS
jgi:hypothetical protein